MNFISQLHLLDRTGANSDFYPVCFGEFYFSKILPNLSNRQTYWDRIPLVSLSILIICSLFPLLGRRMSNLQLLTWLIFSASFLL